MKNLHHRYALRLLPRSYHHVAAMRMGGSFNDWMNANQRRAIATISHIDNDHGKGMRSQGGGTQRFYMTTVNGAITPKTRIVAPTAAFLKRNQSSLSFFARQKSLDVCCCNHRHSCHRVFHSSSKAWQSNNNGDDNNSQSILEAFANLDHERSKRTGFPEAVFSLGKTSHQVATILDDMAKHHHQNIEAQDNNNNNTAILATRVTKEQFQEISRYEFEHGKDLIYHETSRIVSIKPKSLPDNNATTNKSDEKLFKVAVVTAGTTDIHVAEEAAVTLEHCGNGIVVDRIYDVGVAGLHRILRVRPRLDEAHVIIVVAGMDGALPSVVGGLSRAPVVAVPTSIGYGANLGGIAPLLTMLNSCAPGVTVVNIDNGFGAAAWAYKCCCRRNQ